MESIRQWFFIHKKELLFTAIIFIIATTSFGLGYLANREFDHTPIIIEQHR